MGRGGRISEFVGRSGRVRGESGIQSVCVCMCACVSVTGENQEQSRSLAMVLIRPFSQYGPLASAGAQPSSAETQSQEKG